MFASYLARFSPCSPRIRKDAGQELCSLLIQLSFLHPKGIPNISHLTIRCPFSIISAFVTFENYYKRTKSLISAQIKKGFVKVMMEVKPFKAYRFNEAIVGDVGSCIAPPYDIISPAQQQRLYEKSEYNIVRITKGKTTPFDNDSDNQYTRAADYLNTWIAKGILKQDSTEAIYVYVQDFELGGVEYQRFSFVARAKLEEFGKIVKPHEQILNELIIDRLNLKRATAARFGLVFMLYEDKQKIADKITERTLKQQEPLIDFIDEENVRHRLFAITAEDDVDAIMKMMSDKSCIIADGHHRYTTGLTYSKESTNPAAKYQMLAFTNICQDGLIVLATHRVVGDLEDFDSQKLIADLKENFQITEYHFGSSQAKTNEKQKMLAQMKAKQVLGKNAFGIYIGDNTFYVAVLKNQRIMDSVVPEMSSAWKSLDVSVLHKLVLEKLLGIDEEKLARGENVEYVKDTGSKIDKLITKIDAGEKQVVFFMNPPKIKQIQMVTDQGERMPQKSTYFYPKVYTGLTIDKL